MSALKEWIAEGQRLLQALPIDLLEATRQKQQLNVRLPRALAALALAVDAMERCAALDDAAGNELLAATGKYHRFDEPWSVEACRTALAAIERELEGGAK